MWIKFTPNSNAPFERWLSESLWEWINMNTAFTNFLEIVIISIVNANPFIEHDDRRNQREERYKHLIWIRKDKTIPMRMLSDLVNLMQEHHQEKKDVLWEMYEKFISLWENWQFFTPPHIADFMALACWIDKSDYHDKVVDIACWSWKLLLWAMKNNPRIKVYWVDIDRRCSMMACISCFFYGWCWEFFVWNTLINEYSEWRVVSYWTMREIPHERLKSQKFEPIKNDEKSQSVSLDEEKSDTENISSYKVWEWIQKSLF